MDPIISLGQKNTLAEYMILSGADNRPPMLDKDLYDSWKSRMELYIQNREHGRMILESVENGPLIWPTVKENGVIRTKKYVELSDAEKIQADCDMKATNIILQGIPTDIYSLVNHHRVAKDLWERVQLLMQGTSLTKQERECKLYDAFNKLTHIKGESLHTLPPEWSKFVTDVKLVQDLHTSNFDQLHAYLEQHELHANEVRIMRGRNQDSLAFVANQQMTPPHFNPYQISYNNPQLQQHFSPSQHVSIQPNQHYSSHYPSQAQFNHSSIPPSHTFQSQMNDQTSTVPQVMHQAKQPRIWLHGIGERNLLVEAQDAGQILDVSNSYFLQIQEFQQIKLRQSSLTMLLFQELGSRTLYDSDCDDLSSAQAILMANISNYGSDIISEVPNYETYLNDMDNQSVHALQDFEQSPVMNFTDSEISSDSNIIPYS
ncbi:hypothetical protein Tco_0320518 [Tanacetum coccineum]